MHARIAAALAAALVAAPASAVQVWTASATEKIRPGAAARETSAARISAARNEFEAFQIVVTGAAANVRASATALVSGEAAIPVRLYRVALISLRYPSALDGGTGAWPDALVPAVDEVAGEARNAFPFAVPAGESRALWAEVHVPPGTPAGEYGGSVRVTWDGGEATVPVTLTVWPFTLPSTATLKTAFGFTYGALPSEHGVSGDAFSVLRARYGQLALDHRITLSKIDDGNPDLSHLTSVYGPQVDGTAPTALRGARMTSFEFVGRGAYGTWASWFESRGWSDRLFQYTCDEPPLTCAWADIRPRAVAARAANPPLRTLVTTSVQEAEAHGVLDAIDLIVPVVNFMDDRPGSPYAGDQRAKYDAFLASGPGKELWLYESCMSHGCGGTVDMGSPSDTDRYYTGWPSYMIDASAPRNRAMEWLSFKYRATGELYYETAMAYGHDPWADQWDFSGNGDGTLFYPGQPWRIGGATHVPIPSIRLKMIREGMEDYEYLHLLVAAGEEAYARQVVDALFPAAYEADVSPEALLAAREKLARRIVERGIPGGAGPEGGEPGVVPVASGCTSGGAATLLALAGLVGVLGLRRRRR